MSAKDTVIGAIGGAVLTTIFFLSRKRGSGDSSMPGDNEGCTKGKAKGRY